MHVGVDLIEIKRIRVTIDRYGDRFLQRVYTPRELAHCRRRPASLAARWAAKEAVAKALGCGIGEVSWQEIEVLNDTQGAPRLHLHGAAAARAASLHLHEWAISLSHTREHAIAVAMALASADQ